MMPSVCLPPQETPLKGEAASHRQHNSGWFDSQVCLVLGQSRLQSYSVWVCLGTYQHCFWHVRTNKGSSRWRGYPSIYCAPGLSPHSHQWTGCVGIRKYCRYVNMLHNSLTPPPLFKTGRYYWHVMPSIRCVMQYLATCVLHYVDWFHISLQFW